MRRTNGFLAATAGLLLLVSALPATATPEAPDAARVGPVKARELPSAAKVGKIYPPYRNGKRITLRSKKVDILGVDCLSVEAVATPRPTSGRWASYFNRNGNDPYFAGKPAPGVFIYRYASAAQARQAWGIVLDSYSRCLGRTYEDVTGSTRIRREIPVPALGARRFAIRTTASDPLSGGAVHNSKWLQIWVQSGPELASVWIQDKTRAPVKKKAVRLTRVAMRAAGMR